jgi:predicted aconitase with swiveling domain
MKKLYVIGASQNSDALAKIIAENPNLDVVCVNSVDEIPLTERIKSVNKNIVEIKQIQLKPNYYQPYFKEKKKNHERPYKFHK